MTERICLCRPGWEPVLLEELSRTFPRSKHERLAEGFVRSWLGDDDANKTAALAFVLQVMVQPEIVVQGLILGAWVGRWMAPRPAAQAFEVDSRDR